MAGVADPILAPALGGALSEWLAQLAAIEGRRVIRLTPIVAMSRAICALSPITGAGPGLAAITATSQTDLRAWMAQERARGLPARSLAGPFRRSRALPPGLPTTPGAMRRRSFPPEVRSSRRKLPRPLSEDSAAAVLSDIGEDAREDWIAARDTAIATLLYGLRLRISEALLPLTGADEPCMERSGSPARAAKPGWCR